jgi:hypothetical protein
VTNGAGGTIAGDAYGVFTGAGNVSTVTNAGFIAGYTVLGVVFLGGGTIDNQTLGRIGGGVDGIYTGGSTVSTIINDGAVYGYNFAGALMVSGGTLINAGSLSGPVYGVRFTNQPGTVHNTGSISASSVFQSTDSSFDAAGVLLTDGGVVTNGAGGAIRSNWIGVQLVDAPARS